MLNLVEKFCVSCGTEISGADSFCFKCGAKIVNEEKEQHVPTEVASYSYEERNEVSAKPDKVIKSKRNYKPLIIIPIILGLILIPVATISTISSIKVSLGTLKYEIPSTDILSVDLIINNDVGSITIDYDASLDGLFEAEIEVRGGLRASLDDAVNFNHEVVGGKVVISFDTGYDIYRFLSMKQISHQIHVTLNPGAIVNFNVETSTGSIKVYLNGIDNITIEDISLISSTGSVKLIGDYVSNTTFGDVLMDTSTGSITFDMYASVDASIRGLTLGCSTGRIDAYLGEAMIINASTVDISTSTGSIELQYKNIIQYNDLIWNLDTSTGSIAIYYEQTTLPPVNCSSIYNVETSTGSITVDCLVNTELGIEMDADTSTGSINLPGDRNYYSSPDFLLKACQHSFILTTSTGSITASVSN